jgi:hypothetical protein
MIFRAASAATAAAVIVTATSASAQQAARRPSAWRDIQGFNIVLVVGETQRGTSAIEDVPSGARKALNDMREFLPYKYYRVLDSQWTSCCSPDLVRLGTPIAGRLQGVVAGTQGSGGATVLVSRAYRFNLSISETVDGNRIPIRFALRLDEPSSGRGGQASSSERVRESQAADLRAEMESLEMQIKNLQARVEVGTVSPTELRPMQDRHSQLQRRLAETMNDLANQPAGGRSTTIIDSSFTMDVGETVVVGTSRLGGDKALIALVTAVRRSSPAR